MAECVIDMSVRKVFWVANCEIFAICEDKMSYLLNIKTGRKLFIDRAEFNIRRAEKSRDYLLVYGRSRATVYNLSTNTVASFTTNDAICTLTPHNILEVDANYARLRDYNGSIVETVTHRDESRKMPYRQCINNRILLCYNTYMIVITAEEHIAEKKYVLMGRYLGFSLDNRIFYVTESALTEISDDITVHHLSNPGNLIETKYITINQRDPRNYLDDKRREINVDYGGIRFGGRTLNPKIYDIRNDVLVYYDNGLRLLNWRRGLFDAYWKFETAETMQFRIAFMVLLRIRGGLPIPIIKYILSLI